MIMGKVIYVYNSIIFDVDGTVLDSSAGIIDAIKYTINKFGLKALKDKELQDFVGFSPLQGAFVHFCGLDSKSAQNCALTFREYYKNKAMYKSIPYDGIYALLEYLKLKNIKLGVATYKRQDYALELMKHFGFDKYMSAICGADNDNKLTKTDIVNLCIEKLGAAKVSTVLIGDSVHDAAGAQNAGISFIGVTYGFGFKSKDEILKYNPAFCAGSTAELLQYFEK